MVALRGVGSHPCPSLVCAADDPVGSGAMPHQARLIIQLARGGEVDENFARERPQSIEQGDIVLDRREPDENGRLAPPDAGEVVLSVPSPETFTREPDEVRRVIDRAAGG